MRVSIHDCKVFLYISICILSADNSMKHYEKYCDSDIIDHSNFSIIMSFHHGSVHVKVAQKQTL